MYHVYLRDLSVDIVYHPEVQGEQTWSGTVELHRGAPAVDSHPELTHAFLSIGERPELHREFIRHRWEADIPDFYGGLPNTGESRRYLTMNASGAEINWSLVLKLPPSTPQHVFRRITQAFGATIKGVPQAKEEARDAAA